MQSAVTTRMKILADLDLAENRVPQDGRATIRVGGRQVNLRVSSLPTGFGEKRRRAYFGSQLTNGGHGEPGLCA
jgi:type II secretory ATPase GspE/PulE/Tfp pilus assembly ATPase PilB-like protein